MTFIRGHLVGLVLFSLVPSAYAQTSLLPTVQRFRAEYPTVMSEAQKAELLNRVAWQHRADGWGLLRKSAGARCPAPQGVDVACDILVHAPTAWHYDVLIDGQRPTWIDDGPCIRPPSGCEMSRFLPPVRPAQVHLTMGDADGDGKAELAVYRPNGGIWFVKSSATNYTAWGTVQWGLPGDIPLTGDFDGDSNADLVAFRPSNGLWFIRVSSRDYSPTLPDVYQWGLPGDLPMAADFDGDDRTDLSVFRPSDGTWHVRLSTSNYSNQLIRQWGLPGDIPVPGDYDGDRRADIAVYRPSTGHWFLLRSTTNYSAPQVLLFGGVPEDLPIFGDYDGDGKSEIIIYRPSSGVWYMLRSRANYVMSMYQWGWPGDVPVSADHDGDGALDIVVWRPSTGEFFIRYSSSGFASLNLYQWGLPGDIPILRRP
jgi:hypothetical protein